MCSSCSVGGPGRGTAQDGRGDVTRYINSEELRDRRVLPLLYYNTWKHNGQLTLNEV